MLGGKDRPVSISDLPRSTFRKQLESLPPQAQARAIDQLRSVEFPPEDVHSLQVDAEGSVLYACSFPSADVVGESATASLFDEPAAAAIPVSPFPDSLKFHSRPGSTNIIFLDFDGQRVVGTAWNTSVGRTQILARAYSTDNDASTYSDSEQLAIKRIWMRVAEDFAPFDVDVTTEEPASFHNRISHALITRNTDVDGYLNPSSSAGGVAYIGIFAGYNTAYSSPAWVYHNNLSNSEANTAEAVSHEVGHNMGLSHDGKTDGADYYNGHGTGVTSWGPIMGTGYGRQVSQWSKGEYYLANNAQDDLAIMAAKLSYRSDDFSDTTLDAPFLQLTSNRFVQSTTPETDPTGSKLANRGMITSKDDVDLWAFASGAGNINLAVRPWIGPSGTRGGNLDLQIELLNAEGSVIASSAPTTETIATLQTTVTSGVYYLRIKSDAFGDPLSSTPTGFTTYGSIGQYFITGVVADASSVIIPPNAIPENVPDVTSAGAPGYTFDIRYRDNVAIDTATLDDHDITVTGPNGFTAPAKWITTDTPTNGAPRVATYRITPPGGTWDLLDNGVYHIQQNESAVYDTGGTPVAAGLITTFSVTVSTNILEANMLASPGWSLSGLWAYGRPLGLNGDPLSGANGTNVIGYNLGGNYARNLSPTYATTPTFTCAYAESVTLRFSRWLGIANNDSAFIQIATESNSWTTIWSNSGNITDTDWMTVEYDLTPHAAGRTNVQLRWGISANSDSTVRFGWNIDEVEVMGIFQPGTPPANSSIICNLLPSETGTQSTGWRITPYAETNWNSSGALLSGLIPGTYTVTFKPIPGWTTPNDHMITTTSETTNMVYGMYHAISTSAFGVPLWWLNMYGYTNDQENIIHTLGTNGITLWQSYIAGLDPNDAASRFDITSALDLTHDGLVLHWLPQSDRVYSVYSSTEPGTEPLPVPDAQDLMWPRHSYTNHPAPGQPSGILHLRVRIAPQ